MSIISAAMKHYIDSVYSVTKDRYGDSTRTLIYSDVPCRWNEHNNIVFDLNGEQKTTKVDVWLLPQYPIDYNYEFVRDNETYKIVAISKKAGLDGNIDHIRVYLV
jgi:hypothetical protein